MSTRFWQIALLTAAGTVGAISPADATFFYGWDSRPSYYYYQPMQPPVQPHRPKWRHPAKKSETAGKTVAAKPHGPLIIAISLNRQRVRIYDANGFFAEAPVSTGMRGHPTPMGVFSVIQKQRWHRSNIYSGAPMPYMQRITWSGIAMHAGVLPGYPASHGCIRMPTAFAIKMWSWTRMGARVLISPGELEPTSFSHPLLPALKIQPQAAAAEQPATDEPAAAKADKGAPEIKPTTSEAKLDLRPTASHGDSTTPVHDTTGDQTRTANASGAGSIARADAAMAGLSSADQMPTLAQGDKTTGPEQSQGITKLDRTNANPDAKATENQADTKANPAIFEPETPKSSEAGPKPPNSDPAKVDAAKPVKTSDVDSQGTTGGAKDQARLPDAANSLPPRRSGQIAVFISRKDSKLYVRQNFAPLFSAPVTIAPSDRPLGTHVFTAEVDKNDPNVLHWTVVSLPVSTRSMTREEEPHARRRGAHAAQVENKLLPVPDNPAEALDRITIPPDVMARIAEDLTTGGSIIVSDQGIRQGETGDGTDFIVSLR